MNVRLDLGEGPAEQVRDFLVALFFEMKQDQRHPLVIGQLTQRAFELRVVIGALEIGAVRLACDQRRLKPSRLRTLSGPADLAEQSPAQPIARQLILSNQPTGDRLKYRRRRAACTIPAMYTSSPRAHSSAVVYTSELKRT